MGNKKNSKSGSSTRDAVRGRASREKGATIDETEIRGVADQMKPGVVRGNSASDKGISRVSKAVGNNEKSVARVGIVSDGAMGCPTVSGDDMVSDGMLVGPSSSGGLVRDNSLGASKELGSGALSLLDSVRVSANVREVAKVGSEALTSGSAVHVATGVGKNKQIGADVLPARAAALPVEFPVSAKLNSVNCLPVTVVSDGGVVGSSDFGGAVPTGKGIANSGKLMRAMRLEEETQSGPVALSSVVAGRVANACHVGGQVASEVSQGKNKQIGAESLKVVVSQGKMPIVCLPVKNQLVNVLPVLASLPVCMEYGIDSGGGSLNGTVEADLQETQVDFSGSDEDDDLDLEMEVPCSTPKRVSMAVNDTQVVSPIPGREESTDVGIKPGVLHSIIVDGKSLEACFNATVQDEVTVGEVRLLDNGGVPLCATGHTEMSYATLGRHVNAGMEGVLNGTASNMSTVVNQGNAPGATETILGHSQGDFAGYAEVHKVPAPLVANVQNADGNEGYGFRAWLAPHDACLCA